MQGLLLKIWKALHLPKDLQLFFMRRVNDQFLVGVTGIFFDNEDRVLLVKHTYRGRGWSLPGGYAKSGEHPTEALEREVKEETGYEVSGGVLTPSDEVKEAKLFKFDKLPILPEDQLLFIDKALNLRKNGKR